MFCEKCGAKNEDGAKFCEECGAALAESETQKSVFVAPKVAEGAPSPAFGGGKTPAKPMSLKSKIILITAGILIVLCGVLYSAGKAMTNPEKIVKRFVESIISQDYAGAYDCLDIGDSELTTKDMFVKVMGNRGEDADLGILNYEIAEAPAESPLVKNYTVIYTQKNSSGTSSMDVTLVKQASKKWLFYDDYKIAEDGLVAKNYTITIPAGTEFYIDGVLVSESYKNAEESSETEKVYVLPMVFTGLHEMRVTAPFAEEKVFEEDVYDGGSVDVYTLELTEAAKTEVSQTAEAFVKDFVTNAVSKQDIDKVQAYFASNLDSEYVQELYADLQKYGIDEEGVGIKSVVFNGFKSVPDAEYQAGSAYEVQVSFDYNYTALREDWFDEVIEEYTPEDAREGSASVYFTYENGKWMVTRVSINMYLHY